VITPFILSVICYISSEQRTSTQHLCQSLGDEVSLLLVNSPADTFLASLRPTEDPAHLDDESDLDPELGIGIEEIVGALILALFMRDRDKAGQTASTAFNWMRGFMRTLALPVQTTIGEMCGVLPRQRYLSKEDLARTFLLCYVSLHFKP